MTSKPSHEARSSLASAPSYSIADFSQMSLTAAGRHHHHPAPFSTRSPEHYQHHHHHQQQYQQPHGDTNGARADADALQSESGLSTGQVRANMEEANAQLRQELAGLTAKLAQLQRFEHDLDSIRQQHDGLQDSTEKRDRLEQAVRTKLEDRCRRLEQGNKQLKAKLEDARRKSDPSHSHQELMEEQAKRDRIIHTLTGECTSAQEQCDQLRREVLQLTDRAQAIPRLESKVSENEARLKRVQEEIAQQQLEVVQVKEFEAALQDLQDVNSRQDAAEQECRERLENDVITLRTQISKASMASSREDLTASGAPCGVTPHQVCCFDDLLQKREASIQQLNDEVAKWRQLYADELGVTGTDESSRVRAMGQSLADVATTTTGGGETDSNHRGDDAATRTDLFATTQRVIELESAVKYMRHALADLDGEIAGVRQSAGVPKRSDSMRTLDDASPISDLTPPPPQGGLSLSSLELL